METVEDMLETLVHFPSVVGTSNAEIIDFAQNHLTKSGWQTHKIEGPDKGRFNLFATVGPQDRSGYILSGHVDVVRASEPEWLADPFILRRDGEKLIGRGAVDMKGFVAGVLSAAPDVARMALKAPVHISLSYDEEAGCRGIPHLVKKLPELCMTPLGCFVGEPTGMQPVLRHKGKASLSVKSRGIAGHSARPELGENAIHKMLPVLDAARVLARALEDGPKHPAFEPPFSTAQIGTLSGGTALNIIPETAEAAIEVRAIPGQDPEEIIASIRDVAQRQKVDAEITASYPALDLAEGSALANLAAELSGNSPKGAVSFGTEAGVFQRAGIPAIVCGPGDIGRAHKPEEFITRSELAEARDFALAVAQHLT